MIEIQEEKQYADFQIVLLDKEYCHKRRRLVPNGKKVSFCSNNGNDIADFYEKHEQMQNVKIPKKARKRRKKENK